MTPFRSTLRAEGLKLRRSGLTPLLLGTALFVPAIVLLARLRPAGAQAAYTAPAYWPAHLNAVWEAMALLLLPLWLILVATLVVHIESRASGWKQLRAGPQPLLGVLAAKLLWLLALLAALLLVFLLAGWASGVLPARWHGAAPPVDFPWAQAASRAAQAFAALLPIAVLQMLLALQLRGFALPMALGIGLWVLALGSLNWPLNWAIPYGYAAQLHLQALPKAPSLDWPLGPVELGLSVSLAVLPLAGLLCRWRPPQD